MLQVICYPWWRYALLQIINNIIVCSQLSHHYLLFLTFCCFCVGVLPVETLSADLTRFNLFFEGISSPIEEKASLSERIHGTNNTESIQKSWNIPPKNNPYFNTTSNRDSCGNSDSILNLFESEIRARRCLLKYVSVKYRLERRMSLNLFIYFFWRCNLVSGGGGVVEVL